MVERPVRGCVLGGAEQEKLQGLLVLLENFGGFLMEGVGEGVSGRFEGREGSSLDTKFSSETNGKKRLQVKRK